MKHSLLSLLSLTLIAAIGFSAATLAQTPSETYGKLDAAGYGLLVKLPVQPVWRTAFLTLIEPRVAASRMQAGVVDFRVLSTPDANVFLAIETFKDKRAFETFEKLPESQSFLAKLKPLLGGAVEVTVLTPLPKEGVQ